MQRPMTTLTESGVEQAALGWRLCASNGGWYTLRSLRREALLPRLVSEEVKAKDIGVAKRRDH